jgi:hypothetical protein
MNILERILGAGDQQHDDGGVPVLEHPPVETPDDKATPAKPPMYRWMFQHRYAAIVVLLVASAENAFEDVHDLAFRE